MAEIKGLINAKGKGGGASGGNVWHTWTQANFIDGEATFSIGDIVKPNDIPLSVADKILYVDESDKITECYMIDAIGDISVTLEKVGEFGGGGGGSQLYQHNITLKGTTTSSNDTTIMFTIVNSSALPFVKNVNYISGINQDLHQWMNDNHFNISSYVDQYLNACGGVSSGTYAYGIAIDNSNYFYTKLAGVSTQITYTTITDDVITI